MNKRLIVIIGILLLVSASFCLCIDQNGDNGKKDDQDVNVEVEIGVMEYKYKLILVNDDFIEPRDSKMFFSAKVTIRNVGKFNNTISPDDFSLKDTNNNVYQVMKDDLSSNHEQFKTTALAMAEKTEGILYFEIPNSSTPANLICNPNWSKAVHTTIDSSLINIDIFSVKISAIISDKSTAYLITITSVSGGRLNLDDAEFLIADANDVLKYKMNINNANPAAYTDGQSKIYALTHLSSAVTDGNGGTLGASDDIKQFQNCTMAYIDQNSNGKVSPDDSIWVYKDNNNDGTEDIRSKYTFEIKDDNGERVLEKIL